MRFGWVERGRIHAREFLADFLLDLYRVAAADRYVLHDPGEVLTIWKGNHTGLPIHAQLGGTGQRAETGPRPQKRGTISSFKLIDQPFPV